MTFTEWAGRWLEIDEVHAIDCIEFSLNAHWARQGAAWLFFGCVALCALAGLFYFKYQSAGTWRTRGMLAGLRAMLLCILLLFLADPILTATAHHQPRPWLWLLFDGTESMAIADEYSSADRNRLNESVGLSPDTVVPSPANSAQKTRQDYVRAWLRRTDANVVRQLSEKFRIKAYQFDGSEGLRELENGSDGDETVDPKHWAAQLTTAGQSTPLGNAFESLQKRHVAGELSGVLVVSDFDQNSGRPALPAASRLGVPVFTVGVGAKAAFDLSVDLQMPLLMKKETHAGITVTLRQTGLLGQIVPVKLTARRISGQETAKPAADGVGDPKAGGDIDDEPIVIEERNVKLEEFDQSLTFSYTPVKTGRFSIVVEVAAQPGELVTENNLAEREVEVRDDFLRLMFVEYEPTWEWRFIKEVFHRDELVGMRGFRTYLRSADPQVRQQSELFLSTLTPKRSTFFANDVIILGDMPAASLSSRFCEMTREFVGKFGGGLVVLSGPHFGPGQLAQTPLADMLPVVVEPGAALRDDQPFPLRLTADAEQVDFMHLGADAAENRKAWNNIGPLPWYQPVARLHPLATALAEHPRDLCTDGRTRQPLIAMRRYGRGEVVYLAFNETWRLRRKYGERYYRKFWAQMIHRLSLSHALGSQKRFVVRTDRQQYRPDEKVLLTVEAYDANFDPLTEDRLPEGGLQGEVIPPGAPADGNKGAQPLEILPVQEGVFEARIPISRSGEYRAVVTDPVTGERDEAIFHVANVSVERRSIVRNLDLERKLATSTAGRNYDLDTVSRFLKEFQPSVRTESIVKVFSIWNTWLGFAFVLALMLAEWMIRKLVNLP